MSSESNRIRHVAIVGGGGLIGRMTVRALLDEGQFNVTAITRHSSIASFPESPNLKVKRGDYSSHNFLVSALQGQDVLVILLALFAPPDVQTKLIDAAADANVPWILPCEFGSDTQNKDLCSAVSMMAGKAIHRQHIERRGKSSWLAMISNPWLEFSLAGGLFGIDVKSRKAVLYDGGHLPVKTTTMDIMALAIERLLALPIQPDPSGNPDQAYLSDFRNRFVYISSFDVTQTQLLDSVKRATNTRAGDWKVEHKSPQDLIAQGKAKLRNHNPLGMVDILYGNTFTKGMGDGYRGIDRTANQALALPLENLDLVVARLVQRLT